MNLFKIIITSRNYFTIRNFFLFLKTNNLSILKSIFQKKKRKKLTILKSPHVNKTAQEQFEKEFFKKQFQIQTMIDLNYLIFLKKLNFNIYPDANIILKCNNINNKNLNFKIFNPNNFKFNKYSYLKLQNVKSKLLIKNKNRLLQKLNYYIHIIDIYGESTKMFK